MEQRPQLAGEFDRLRAAAGARLFGTATHTPPPMGRFRLLRRLGRGGMGEVWAAHDPQLQRDVAIKILRAGPGDDQARTRRRWLREARALAKVSHPNVVHVYEVGEDGPEAYFAMELVAGRTLRGFDVEHGHARAEVIDAYLQAARGLAAAHAAELVHRDFKPDNVLRAEDGRVRVVDFGLARAQGDRVPTGTDVEPSEDDGDERITRTGAVLGTPAYMAPEQREGGPVDARSDQYAWCVALLEALHGRRPTSAAAADGDDALATIVRRGLAEAPHERWPSMDALVAAIEASGRPRRRRGWVLAAGATAAVAVAAGVFASSPDPSPDPACDRAEATLRSAWNDARAEQLHAHLRTATPQVADASFERLRGSFDELAGQWRELAASTCEAPRLELRALATVGCLEARAELLDAVVTTLEQAPAARLFELDRVLELPPIEDCAQPDRLRQRMPLPPGEAARHRVQSLRLAIAQADLARRLGDPAAASRSLDELGPSLSAAAFEPLSAEWSVARAEALIETGDYARGRQAANEAIAAAKRASTPLSEAHGWILLGMLEGYVERNAETGARDLDLAEAALSQAGGDAKLEVLLAAYRGHVSLGAGRFEEALAAHRHALTLERARREASPLEGQLLDIIGTVLRRQGRFDEAEEHMRQAHALLSERVSSRHPKIAASLMALGNLALQRGETAAAIERYEQARTALGDTTSEVRPRLLNNLGQAYLKAERVEQAERTLAEAVALYEARADETIESARARSSLGRALRVRGELPAALAMAEAAVLGAERAVGAEHPELARILFNRALTLEATGDAQGAERDARRVLAITSDSGTTGGAHAGAQRLLQRLRDGAGPAVAAD
ncbi:MAG: serine/threonine-protein kinase [Nannocystaceae bacterium]